MHTCSICATCGRHTLLERSLRFFLEQDYTGKHTFLIYNNSAVPQTLAALDLPENKKVLLYNQHLDSTTGAPYTTLGAIYNDILSVLPEDVDVINHSDDDDIFLPNHLTEGVKGYLEGKTKAYKPSYSWYRSKEGVVKTDNNLEPSIFVSAAHVKAHGYSLTTTQQHLQWLHPLIDAKELYIKVDSTATLVYNWGDTALFTFKTSGRYDDPNNFNNYRSHSLDHGDQIIQPWPSPQVQQYYKQIQDAHQSKR